MSNPSNGQQQGGEAPAAPAAATTPPAAAAASEGAAAAAPAPAAAAADAAPAKTVHISFKVSGGTHFTLDVDEDWSVRTLKEKCEEKTQIPVAAQRLIYKGAI